VLYLADAVTINLLIRPPLAALLAWLVLREALPWLGWLAPLACLGAVALVAHPPFLFRGHQQWGAARLEGVAVDVFLACFDAGGAGRAARGARKHWALGNPGGTGERQVHGRVVQLLHQGPGGPS
jgi:hypothetical protein